MLSISANISLLYRDLPLLDRVAAAADAGFSDIETWWPFAEPAPPPPVVAEFLVALERHRLALRGLNFYAGDMSAGARGLVSVPSRKDELMANLPVVHHIAEATGCRVFNALYGHRTAADSAEIQDATAVDNLEILASDLAELGGVVVLEALKSPDNGDYPLLTLDDADRIRSRVNEERGVDNIGLLFDTFHLRGNGVDLEPAFTRFASQIRHVQVADFPGRGAPGTGSIDFPSLTRVIADAGYDGFIGCEFLPGETRVDHDDLLRALTVGS
jgi:hydroxypyruvate isomerase